MRRILLGLASALLLAEEPPKDLELRTTLRLETLHLPQNEAMGLVGLSSTAAFGAFYLGPGLYGAARGERGGFFTFGLEGGVRGRPFPTLPLEWDAGLFLGGGGGAGAPQGGGLMVRPHLGLALPLGNFRLGAEWSRVRFPNGGIDSHQAALTLAYASRYLWMPEGSSDGVFGGPGTWSGGALALEVIRVAPTAGAHTRSGTAQGDMDLAGASLAKDLDELWFRYLTVDGAFKGASSGYAQAQAGLGLHTPIAGPLGLEARLGAGMGGGGDVATGGGLLVSGEGALTLGTGAWRASLGVGFLSAPGGEFDSRTVALRISHRMSTPVPRDGGDPLGIFHAAQWRVGSGLLSYAHAQRQDGSDGPIQLMTLRVDRLLNEAFYLTGEAGSATGGGAGGYSTGLAGLGCQTPAWACQRLFLEAAVGAGGGGGLTSGGGFLLSGRAGWRLEWPMGFGLEATVGTVRAPHGELDTPTWSLGLHLRFAALER